MQLIWNDWGGPAQEQEESAVREPGVLPWTRWVRGKKGFK